MKMKNRIPRISILLFGLALGTSLLFAGDKDLERKLMAQSLDKGMAITDRTAGTHNAAILVYFLKIGENCTPED